MSEKYSSPPGFSTRAISLNTWSLKGDRLMTQFDTTTSTDSSSMPRAPRSSMNPQWNSTLERVKPNRAICAASCRRAKASCCSVMSTPMTRPEGPTSFEQIYTSRPVPHPKSSTVAPSSAGGMGEPHP